VPKKEDFTLKITVYASLFYGAFGGDAVLFN
jgi:hypothetical protein